MGCHHHAAHLSGYYFPATEAIEDVKHIYKGGTVLCISPQARGDYQKLLRCWEEMEGGEESYGGLSHVHEEYQKEHIAAFIKYIKCHSGYHKLCECSGHSAIQ